jgi:hypothetical protein
MKVSLLGLFLLGVVICNGQTTSVPKLRYGSVRVTVIDASNSEPLPYANVYLNRTTIGGYTNSKGQFELGKLPFGTHELVISSLGHKPYQRKLVVKDTVPLYITVKLAVKLLKEVQVRGKRDDKWNRQLARFEKLFFGDDHHRECIIANPWVLNFRKTRGEFSATAQEPLVIENKYLGYSLSFEIRNFAIRRTDYIITGNVRFTGMISSDSTMITSWKQNREEAYRGSPQHFFRNVVDETLSEEGYEIYTDRTEILDLVRSSHFQANVGGALTLHSLTGNVSTPKDEGAYVISLPPRLEVHYLHRRVPSNVYRNITHPVSWIEVKNGSIAVNADGIVQNPQDLTLFGTMGDLRVAEWLPFDYKFPKTYYHKPQPAAPFVAKILLERPYLQTDRPYYYNQETVWLKGYMNYSAPLLKDTLSQTIYVELLDRNGHQVSVKQYPVENGSFNGDIVLSKDLLPGPYQLKAYTQWMLNFDPGMIFTKTISILGEKEAVRLSPDLKFETDTTGHVVVRSDKNSYSAREKITLTIDVTDSLDFPTISNLSVSVTDITQAVPPDNEKTILSSDYHVPSVREDSMPAIRYNIQYGIDFNGLFQVKKKPTQGVITVFQDKRNDPFGLITTEAGRFQQSISFYDTVEVYIHARSVVGKPGEVLMDSAKFPKAPMLPLAPLSLDIYATDRTRQGQFGNRARILQEVVIKAKKIERPPSPAVIHGQGDYTVSGDWIVENNIADLPLALAWKVPGISVHYGIEPYMVFRNGPGGGDVLVLIDGVAVSGPAAPSLYELLASIPPQSVERVDVIKFSMGSIYGSRGAGGVIAVFTKKGKDTTPTTAFDKRKLQAVTITGYATATKFEAPDYSKPDDNGYFDYRPTIYWNPNVNTVGSNPATISFYAGDAVTHYRVVVEGTLFDGTPVRGETMISVNKGR